MTKKEILQKAIDKAVKNGWKPKSIGNYDVWDSDTAEDIAKNTDAIESYSAFDVIYSHDFAKHFFGEEDVWSNRNYEKKPYVGSKGLFLAPVAWQYHLQQMVVSDEPIKYLESYL